jgi:hypothetical protein
MSRESQFFFIAPQNRKSFESNFGKDLVEIGNLILALVTDEHQHGSLVGGNATLEKKPDPIIQTLSNHFDFLLLDEVYLSVHRCDDQYDGYSDTFS